MPRDKDLKRLVRTRMKKTGESYTTARAQLTDRTSSANAAPAAAAEPRPDHAALAGKSDAIIRERTGRDWAQWLRELDAHDAQRMSHRDIAKLVGEKYEVDGWWAQTVTVGYERIRGLRDVGQRRGGDYGASKSRTFAVPVDELFDACANGRRRGRWLPGVKVEARPQAKPPSIRLQSPAEGGVTMLWFVDKGPAKSTLAVEGRGLRDRAAIDRFKAEWSARIEKLEQLLLRT